MSRVQQKPLSEPEVDTRKITPESYELERRFLLGFCGFGLGGLFAPMAAQTDQRTASPAWAERLSPAVVKGVVDSTLAIGSKSKTGRITGTDIRNLSLSSEIFFNHLDEIGGTRDLEQRMKDSGVFKTIHSRDEFIAVRRRAGNAGIVIDDARFERLVFSQAEQMPKVNATFQRHGCRGMHTALVAGLRQVADELDRQSGLPIAAGHPVTGSLRLAQVLEWDLCASVTVLALYLGVWSTMLELGAIFIPGVGAYIAATGLILAVLTFFCA